TIRNPWTTLLAPLSTRQHDYLANDYFGVSPFEVRGGARVKFRLRPSAVAGSGDARATRLVESLAHGTITLRLDVRADRLGTKYSGCAEIVLVERAALNDDSLRFDPFRSGRGVRPVGLVHNARVATYALSRRSWPGAPAARTRSVTT
ncbi:MAG TPA: hypothetical protein VK524_28900, partial [Polyangiaceae bacterium]|nr:hypothetical protein [Polyangiaceae bacterium]